MNKQQNNKGPHLGSAIMATLLATASSSNAQEVPLELTTTGFHGNSTTPDSSNGSLEQNTQYNDTVFSRWDMDSKLYSYIVPVLFFIILIVGLVGNGTLIISVLANKVMRNVPNILIVSLSLGDFLLILVSVPMTATIYTFKNWPYGKAACKANEFMQTLSLGVSVFTLCALSADRYVAIVNPMAKMTGRTQRTTVATAVIIWIISALLAVPDAVFSTTFTVSAPKLGVRNVYCSPFPPDYYPYPKPYYLTRLIVYLILPVFIIGFFYVMMARMLIRSNELVPIESKSAHGNHQRQMDARKKVARVVLSFVVIFVLCWLPRHIYLMWFYFNDDPFNDFWLAFKITGFCLTFINSCVNPFALYFLSSHFRKYYNRYLFCLCRRKRYVPEDQCSTLTPLNSTMIRRVSDSRMSEGNSQL
ncbi:neuromedin-b receptor [Plakobranchus ocellatus]|uniref:Neuromedin-b receptor n=1 Tax=Plakobranchus ocellatus TaxID=259542 RepID=A0AAV3YNY0_9GAST|nr:neuromedin-b receptor [Plakobranchus ocellatus]